MLELRRTRSPLPTLRSRRYLAPLLALTGFSLALSADPAPASARCPGTVQKAALHAPTNVVEVAATQPQLSTLVAAIKAAGLADDLASADSITVFAPTNEAFERLPKGTVERLLRPENRHELQRILKYHVSAGELRAREAARQVSADTLAGPRVSIQQRGDTLEIDAARVIAADIDGKNAVVHLIDRVLLPPDMNIAETAERVGSFSKLLAAADAAGFLDDLRGRGPYTVLAPTDRAFSKLPTKTVSSLLEPGNREALRRVLRNHIIKGRVFADEAVAARSTTNAAHEQLRFALADGRLKVNGVTVRRTDVQARNGIIHVIDEVLVP